MPEEVGSREEAEAKGPSVIDILIPVLGRPHNAAPLVQNIREVTTVEHRIMFMCSSGDHAQIQACEAVTKDDVSVVAFAAGRGDYARKINLAFEWSDSEWVLNASDDITFTDGWWKPLRNIPDHISVVATNDRANASVKRGRFGTHCLIRRSYIDQLGGTFDNQPGVVMFEGYDHNYVDRELCAAAQTRGVYHYAPDAVITHRHPLWKTAEWDDTYRKGHARIREDAALYEQRLRAFTQPTTVI